VDKERRDPEKSAADAPEPGERDRHHTHDPRDKS